MNTERTSAFERVGELLEAIIVRTVQVLLMIMTASAAVVLVVLVFRALRRGFSDLASTEELHVLLQRGFGGVLVVLLGLELLDTVKSYFSHHRNRVQVILVVAMIAVGRHIIQLDFDHASSSLLVGLSVLMLALAGGMLLISRAGQKSDNRRLGAEQ